MTTRREVYLTRLFITGLRGWILVAWHLGKFASSYLGLGYGCLYAKGAGDGGMEQEYFYELMKKARPWDYYCGKWHSQSAISNGRSSNHCASLFCYLPTMTVRRLNGLTFPSQLLQYLQDTARGRLMKVLRHLFVYDLDDLHRRACSCV